MSIAAAIEATRQAIEAEPGRAQARFRAEADLVGPAEVHIRTGRHTLVADEPPSMGGGGVAANPVQMVLASLASCQAITYRYWAERLGLRLDGVQVRVEGTLDVRGFLGFQAGASPGLADVRCIVELRGPEDDDRYAELVAAVDAHCPVLDLFSKPVTVERSIAIEK